MRLSPSRLTSSVLVALMLAVPPAGAAPEPPAAGDDVVVVAVLDGSFSPYHWDFLASQMPQHLDGDPANDLPLRDAPDTWLSGFPDAGTFASYQPLPISLDEENPLRSTASLQADDAAVWDSVQQSTAAAVHYRWIPGTKFIGAVDFAGNKLRASNTAHGANTSAVSVGNLHGTCPECVFVAVTYGGDDLEAASNWAMQQPWIDVVTNSYGFSRVGRERIYAGSDTGLQRDASERGQSILFSAGNGILGTGTVPNTTYYSSQEGPDWILTVGGTAPGGGQYTGTGKPADLAGIANGYPSLGGTTVNGTGTFSGTSNATPQVAGLLARSLWWARQQLAGPSRVQDGGVVARGTPVACGAARADCELGDGVLTAQELRTRFLEGAVRTPQGPNPSGSADVPIPFTTDEYELASEGHGTYFGRLNSTEEWLAEEARVTGPMDGSAEPTPRPAGEREWMTVDSYCRQELWGAWAGGYYVDGQTPMPAVSPLWPARTALASSCDELPAPF